MKPKKAFGYSFHWRYGVVADKDFGTVGWTDRTGRKVSVSRGCGRYADEEAEVDVADRAEDRMWDSGG